MEVMIKVTSPKLLNWIFFDELFRFQSSNSGVRKVNGTADALQTIATDNLTANKNGYLYTYVSNESAIDVIFDNIVVNH
jgi:CRISPR/Cas system Type II protein with McrA/HNH and RuvC-like nuclease domain